MHLAMRRQDVVGNALLLVFEYPQSAAVAFMSCVCPASSQDPLSLYSRVQQETITYLISRGDHKQWPSAGQHVVNWSIHPTSQLLMLRGLITAAPSLETRGKLRHLSTHCLLETPRLPVLHHLAGACYFAEHRRTHRAGSSGTQTRKPTPPSGTSQARLAVFRQLFPASASLLPMQPPEADTLPVSTPGSEKLHSPSSLFYVALFRAIRNKLNCLTTRG